MNIFYSNPTTLRIEWPPYDAKTTAELMRRLNTVPGIEGRGRRYYAPMIQFERLLLLFPKASFDYRAMQEADILARRFFESLAMMRVELDWDEFEDVMAIGDNVSPVLQQLIHDRRHALKPLLVEAQTVPKQVPVRRELQPVGEVQYPKRRKARKQRKAT